MPEIEKNKTKNPETPKKEAGGDAKHVFFFILP